MAFARKKWKFSDLSEEDVGIVKKTPLREGYHTLYIEDATFDEEKQIYKLKLTSVDFEGEQSEVSFFFEKKDGGENRMARGTLGSLGKALAGEWIGVPSPEEVKHGIVCAEISLSAPKVNRDGVEVQYPKLYKFEPCRESAIVQMMECGYETIEQFALE